MKWLFLTVIILCISCLEEKETKEQFFMSLEECLEFTNDPQKSVYVNHFGFSEGPFLPSKEAVTYYPEGVDGQFSFISPEGKKVIDIIGKKGTKFQIYEFVNPKNNKLYVLRKYEGLWQIE